MPRYYVYVLHCREKLADHAQHYCGATSDLLRRLIEHATARGAKITRAFAFEGIEWEVASVFVMEHRTQFLAERRVKKYHRTCLFCGVCSGDEIKCIAGATSVDVESLGIPTTSEALRAYAQSHKE